MLTPKHVFTPWLIVIFGCCVVMVLPLPLIWFFNRLKLDLVAWQITSSLIPCHIRVSRLVKSRESLLLGKVQLFPKFIATIADLCPTHINIIRRNILQNRQCTQEKNSHEDGNSPTIVDHGPSVDTL